MDVRGFRYRLSPTSTQEDLFRQFAGVCRMIYNLGWEQRATWGRTHKIGYVRQAAELTLLRAEFDFVRAVNVSCQQQALRDLDKAFSNFFAGRARFPTPRRKGINDTFRFPGRDVEITRLNAKWSAVRLPKIGWVKFRDTRHMRGELKNVTISRDAIGWHVSFAREVDRAPSEPIATSVGIDRGVAVTLALSTGETFTLPNSLACLDSRLRRAQRVLARRRKGSNRRRMQLARCARLAARRARIRRDFHHKAALSIVRRFGTVVVEDLPVRAMTASAGGTVDAPGRMVRQKAGLNRSILNAGWAAFARILTYKLEERGGHLVSVPAAYTSQTCSECGVINKRSRESQARFSCVECGHQDNADITAAKNIRRRNTALLGVEGLHKRPYEASTSGRSKSLEIPAL